MAGTVEAKTVCEKCDAEIRENTSFCYNCGSAVADNPAIKEADGGEAVADDRVKTALDDLAEKLKNDESEAAKLAKAAEERKKARVGHRRSREFRWEPREGTPTMMIAITAFVSVLALIVVLLTVVWK